MKPLSVGNVVSAGFRIYRDNFKKYFNLAFIAYLWVLVPVYGWAKFAANSGLIARLAYGEVTEKPEAVHDARRYIKPRMWDFFAASLLVGLASFAGIIVLVIIVGVIMGIATAIGSQGSTIGIIFAIILGLIGVLVFLFGFTWLLSRLFLYDLSLAIEENTSATSSIGRGWSLSEGFVLRLQLIIFVAFLITIPISMFTNIVSFVSQFLTLYIAESNPAVASLLRLLIFLFQLLLSFAAGALIIPFWQAIKAVIYYDLLVRKEGLGLELETPDDFTLE